MTTDNDLCLLNLPDVLGRVGVSRSTLYRLMKAGRFPAPRKINGINVLVWSSADVRHWIEQQLTDAA